MRSGRNWVGVLLFIAAGFVLSAAEPAPVPAAPAPVPQVASPKPNCSALVFTDVGSVEFEAPPEGTVIRFTLDGTTPTAKSYVYSAPLRAAESLMITAACFKGEQRCSPPVTVDCARWADVPDAKRDAGLYASVANGSWGELPVMSTLAADIKPVVALSLDGQKDPCAIQFEGFIQIKKDGTYTFSVEGNGPTSLRLATARVVKDHAPGTVALKAGVYPFVFVCTANAGAIPNVFIEGPEVAKQKIPTELFSRGAKPPIGGITVTTSMDGQKFYKPELAVDGRPGTFFWTTRGLTTQDHFTLTFAKPVALNDVEVITGKPEGGDSLEKGVLEISEDGTTFSEVAPFKYGNASAALNDKQIKALRIRPTKAQGGWLAIREIYLNAKAPALSGKPTAAINLDFSDSPEMKDWALRAQKDADAEYPSICERLKSEGFTAPRQIMFIFKKDKGIAWTIGTTITFAQGWIEAHPRDTGTVIHELTHVIQSYHGKNPGWLVEGVADYVRWFNWEPIDKRPHVNPARAKYTNGYQDTAAFLVWIEKTVDKDFTAKANKAMRESSFSMDIFKDATGKDLEALWKDFVESSK